MAIRRLEIEQTGRDGRQESPIQHEAFNFFYAMGHSRTLALVAKQFGYGEDTIRNWSSNFYWMNRIEKQELKKYEKMRKSMTEALEAERKRYLEIVKELITSFEKELKEKLVKIKSIYDLEKVIKLGLLLRGEDTEKAVHRIEFVDVESPIHNPKDDIDMKDVNKFPGEY